MGSEGWPPASFLEVVAAATEDSRPRPIGFDWAENMHMMFVSQQQQQQQQSYDWGIIPILGGVASRTCDYAMLDFSHPQLSTMAATTTAHSMLRFGSKPPMNQLASFSPRSSSSNTNNIRCQAEGCHADLSAAKHYHRRHKVCQYHSKAATVLISDSPQRFCQQCSRFHPLAEFDDEKRSCRKRLADHNKRRRKTHTDPNIKLAPLIVSTAANQGDEPASGIKTAHGCKALLALGSNLEADTFRIQNQTNSHAILEKDEELYRKMDGSLSWLHPKLEQPARSEAVTGTSSENLQKPSHAGSHWILRASVNNNNKHDHNSMGLSLHDIKPTEQEQPVSLLYHRHSNTFP